MEASVQDKNVAIAKMLGKKIITLKEWDESTDVQAFIIERCEVAEYLNYHGDYNRQYEAIDFIENIGRDAIMVNQHDYRVTVSENSCKITNGGDFSIEVGAKRQQAIFDALYVFSQTYKLKR